jgi:hypothetical protein
METRPSNLLFPQTHAIFAVDLSSRKRLDLERPRWSRRRIASGY